MKRSNRPASSRQAQEYLNTGASAFGNALAAFQSINPPINQSIDAPVEPSINSSLSLRVHTDAADAEINQCLKRLTKRDPITKLRAIDELVEKFNDRPACINQSVDAFLAVYQNLAPENDRRVREAIYRPMRSIIADEASKRLIGKHMKSIFPYWWQHCFDPVKEVANAALDTFKLAFPTLDKQQAVLKYARDEYINQSRDLLMSTPTSLSDMTVMTPEQAEERYARMVAADLLALAAYISTLNQTNQSVNQSNKQTINQSTNTENDSEYAELFNQAITLMKSKRSIIRRATYQLFTTILTHCPNYVSTNQSIIVPALIDAFGETDKPNAAPMWDAVLKLMQTQPNFVDYLKTSSSSSKSINQSSSQSINQSGNQSNELKPWKQLFTTIRAAGFGASDALYQNALPLLASLPHTVTNQSFNQSFLDALFQSRLSINQSYQGIYSANVDMTVAFLCFIECALYIIVHRKLDVSNVSASIFDQSFLPVIRHLLITDEINQSTKVLSEVARSLVVISRHMASNGTVQSLRDIPLANRLSEICESAIEIAEKDSDNQSVNQSIIWSRIEMLLTQMDQEWRKRKSDQSINQSIDFLTPFAAHVLDRSINSFKKYQSLSAIHCARMIGCTFDLPVSSMFDKLLSILSLLLTSPFSNETTLTSSMEELMALIGASIDRADRSAGSDQLVQLAHTLCTCKPISDEFESNEVLVHIISLNAFLKYVTQPFIALSSAVHQSVSDALGVTFDDEALALTEFMLTSENTELDQPIANVISSLMPLLSPATRLAIVDSLIEGLVAFDHIVPRFASALSANEINQFESESGVKMHSVPSIITVLTPFSSMESINQLEPDLPKARSMRDSIITCMFFAQFSQDQSVRDAATQFWASVNQPIIDTLIDSLLSVAEQFQQSLIESPVVSMTSDWIVQWSEQATQLVNLVQSSNRQASKQSISQVPAVITKVLPEHTALHRMITARTEESINAERLRIIRDCIGELVDSVGAATLLDDGDSVRLWLIVDLLAVNEHLALFSRHRALVDHGVDKLIEVAFSNPSSGTIVLERLTHASIESGKSYSDALAIAWARVAIQPQDFTQLVLRHLLLPLASIPVNQSTKTPSNMTSLIQPLASALPTTLTEEYASSVSAFLSAPDIKQTKLDALIRASTIAFDGLRADALIDGEKAKIACRILLVIAQAAVHWDQFSSWMNDQLVPMLEDFSPSKQANIATIAMFHRARVMLALAQFQSVNSSTAAMQRSIDWLNAALSFALTLLNPNAHCLTFLIESIELAETVTRVFVDGLIDQSVTSVDFISTSRLLFSIACSPVVKAISVLRFELTLERLLTCVVLTMRRSNGATEAILENTPFMQIQSITQSSKPPVVGPNDPTAQLFSLLAHPFTEVAVRSYELISIACVHRAITAAVDVDDDRELDEVKRVIQDQQKSNQSINQSTNHVISEEQIAREEEKRRKQRQAQQQLELRERVSVMLPAVLQCVVEQRMDLDNRTNQSISQSTKSTNQSVNAKNDAYDAFIFPTESPALRLRGHLMCSLLLLDVMESSAPSSHISMTDAKRGVMIAYLREFDVMTPILNEAIQHVLVAFTPQQRDAWLNETKLHMQQSDDVIPPCNAFHLHLDASMLEPQSPGEVETRSNQSINVLNRYADLQRQSLISDNYIDESIFYPTLASIIYLRSLRVTPVLARSWFTNTDRVSAAMIQKCTGSSFSPAVITLELSRVQDEVAKLGNSDEECELKVRVDASAATVNAKYTRGEVSLGLSLRLSSVHPLQPVTVEFTDSVKLTAASTRKWQVAITSALSQSNGGVAAAIAGWTENIDKQLAGVEECSICMSIVNPQNHSLPRIKCTQCKQGFHSICIFQWFEKSGNSTCPLCRTPL